MLNCWLVLPLIYFYVLTKVVRRWFLGFCTKASAQRRNQSVYPVLDTGNFPIASYYECYKAVTMVVQTMDDLFNTFILLSAARCVFTVVLFLYVVMVSGKDFPLTKERYPHPGELQAIAFGMGWTLVEVFAACAFLGVFAWAAAETNRACRTVIGHVLNMDMHGEEDRFMVFLFVQKISTQFAWGITAWKAFLIERGFILTVGGLISTYFALVWKYSDGGKIFIPKTINGSATAASDTVMRMANDTSP